MKINYTFLFIIPLALVLVMDQLFIELMSPNNEDRQGMILNMMIKGMAALSLGYGILFYRRMSKHMKLAFGLLVVYIAALVFESKYVYGSFMVYPHVFMKVFIFTYAYFVYTYYKGNYHIQMKHVTWFILGSFLLNVLLVNSHTLSVSAFTNHERGVYSNSVYMLTVPFLYFLSNYFYHSKFKDLFMAFFVLFLIFFFQHRTVWITTAFVLAVYYLLIRFKTDKPINFVAKLLPIGTVVGVLALFASGFILSIHPEIVDKIQESFSDIENYDKQGTGGWRYQQILSYVPFIQENFMLGMRFEGFELPIQFYRDDLNAPVFEDGNGHHFHSFYVEVLFYTGLVGFILFLLFYLHPIVMAFRRRVLTINQIILVAFISSGFVFGISYVLPVFFYGVVGWAIAAMEEERVTYKTRIQESGMRMRARRESLQKTLHSV